MNNKIVELHLGFILFGFYQIRSILTFFPHSFSAHIIAYLGILIRYYAWKKNLVVDSITFPSSSSHHLPSPKRFMCFFYYHFCATVKFANVLKHHPIGLDLIGIFSLSASHFNPTINIASENIIIVLLDSKYLECDTYRIDNEKIFYLIA